MASGELMQSAITTLIAQSKKPLLDAKALLLLSELLS